MINHYSSEMLHEARRQDLMNEAKGGWLLKQAREAESTPRRPKVAQRVLFILLIGAALVIGVLLWTFTAALPAAADAANTGVIAGTWYGNMIFPNHSVQHIMVNTEGCTAGSVCGYVQNYPAQGTSSYTSQPDGSLLHVHVNPLFTTDGILKQRPNTGQ